MLPVTPIDTFYNGLTLRYRDTINAAAGGTFLKRRPEDCYDLIENMTTYNNDWDTSVQWSESSSSITSSSFDSEIIALKAEMAEINKNLMKPPLAKLRTYMLREPIIKVVVLTNLEPPLAKLRTYMLREPIVKVVILTNLKPHDLDFMPEPVYPEYIPLKDEHILPAEEQPLPPVVSPTAESPGYVAESNLEEDPKEYEEDEKVDGPVDYPMDGGDDGDDDDGDSYGYDADDEDEDEEDEGEEEEHLALANSTVVIPVDELASPPKGMEPIIPPPSTDNATTGARITIRPLTSISLPLEAEVERLLAIPTPSPSPLTLLSPPSARERLARCTAPATLPSPPLPPPLYPPLVDRRDDILESEQPPRKRLCLSTLGSREVGYGIRDTWVDLAEAVPEMAPTTLEKVNTRVTELAELHEHDTQDLYALL
nr:reverse transcriptase domain-containing protein [Tanacetum cinerariifolium]